MGQGGNGLIHGVRKFAMDVQGLEIDLIDRINPFGEACKILAKTIGETRNLAKRALRFTQDRWPATFHDIIGPLGEEDGRKGSVPRLHETGGYPRLSSLPGMMMPFRPGLGVEVELQAAISRAPREKQILADFEEIQRFVAHHGHAPQQGEDHDVFACLHAVRLERIQGQADCRALVEPLDHQGLLAQLSHESPVGTEAPDNDALLAALGIDAESQPITQLKHVRSSGEKQAAEEIARRDQARIFTSSSPALSRFKRNWTLACGRPVPLKNMGQSMGVISSLSVVGKPMWRRRAANP